MKHYLIVHAGYEGIEEIVGLFDRDKATSKMREFRNPTGHSDECIELNGTHDSDEEPYCYCKKPERYCVMEVDENGAKCVCSELGFSLENQVWY